MRRLVAMMLCAAALAGAGCDDDGVSERERSERSDALFAEAMAAEGRGDVAGAETLYRRLLTQNGAMASAHLNLAILQHDARKNYVEAIHHYQAYLDLQPESEKAGMVRERLAAARGLLATQLAADVVAREQRALEAERDSLKAQIRALEGSAADARRLAETKDKEIEALKSRIDGLQKLVDALKTSESETRTSLEAEVAAAREAAAKAEAEAKEATEPGSAAEIAAIRALSKQMLEEPDGGQAAINAATRKAVEGAVDAAPLSATPVPGKRYTVRPGDTLSRLAREAYGNAADWVRIRDANRSVTNPDGRLRAGDVIVIP